MRATSLTRSFDLGDDCGPLRREVFVLGAGFSIAIAEQMPTTAGLRAACNELLGPMARDWLRRRGLDRVDDFEVVLSELAIPQPYLNECSNQYNQAVFTEYSGALHDAVVKSQAKGLQDPCPSWLARFVTTAHFQRSTLVTFNYDTLIEGCVRGGDAALVASCNSGEVKASEWSELIEDQPPLPPGSVRLGVQRVPTLQLLKLHGSVNWYWTPGDISGSTLNRSPDIGSFGCPRAYDEDAREHELPGRVPFIIPPTAIKSSYYGLPLTKELWNRAHRSLHDATHITAIGYSFPATDLTTLGLLRSALRPDHIVQVVNPDADRVAERLTAAGIRAEASFSGENAVARFVDDWAAAVSTSVAVQLEQRELLEVPLAVAWGSDSLAAVTSIDRCEGSLLLRTEDPTSGIEAIQRSRERRETPVKGYELHAKASGEASSPVFVVDGDTKRPVVGVTMFKKVLVIGYEPRWAILHLADRSRSSVER